MLTEAAKEAKRAYLREWRKRNKAKQREYENRYWERKAEEMEQKANEDGRTY